MLPTLPPLRVLILEDNEDDYELDLSYLRENFVPVGTRIYSAADFRRELSEGVWDIILCDFNMPQFTAFDALEILRDSGLDIPCIIVSGSVSEETAVSCIKAGAQDYLVKDRLLKLPLVVERELHEAALRAERKSVELALQESNRDVQNFRAALEAIAIVSVTDLNGDILYVNEAFLAISQYSATEVIGQNHRLLNSGTHSQEFFTTMWQTISSGKPWRDEICNRAKDGSLYWVDSIISPMFDEHGLVYQYMSTRYDITERKKAEAALTALNRTLEQRVEERTRELTVLNNEKNEFLGIAAHDLKNPLSGILSSAEILERYYGGEAVTKRYVSMIVSASEQMLDIIANLLDVNKIESGHKNIHTIPISLDVVSAVVEDYQQRATSKGIILRYHTVPDEPIPTVIADEQALWQVMDNLVSNAVKYSPQWKTVNVLVLSRTDKEGKRFGRVEIQDEGPGISEADMGKLFAKFARLSAQPTGGENSTGLGLSIVKKLVELQRGQVWCESELGKGATFIVELPCA